MHFFYFQKLHEEVITDVAEFGDTFRDEGTLMSNVIELMEKYEKSVAAVGINKWKLPTSGRPISLFGSASIDDYTEPHRAIRPQDDSEFLIEFLFFIEFYTTLLKFRFCCW